MTVTEFLFFLLLHGNEYKLSEKNIKKAAGVCVMHPYKPDHVLAATRGLLPPIRWGLIGGKVEHGECFKAAAIREAREESGLLLSRSDLLKHYSDMVDGWEVVFYLVRPSVLPNTKKVTREGWVKWVPIETVCGFQPFSEYNEKLFKYFNIKS